LSRVLRDGDDAVPLERGRLGKESAPAGEVRLHVRVLSDADLIAVAGGLIGVLDNFDEAVLVGGILKEADADAPGTLIERDRFVEEREECLAEVGPEADAQVELDGG
jgi:hypothetical protein